MAGESCLPDLGVPLSAMPCAVLPPFLELAASGQRVAWRKSRTLLHLLRVMNRGGRIMTLFDRRSKSKNVTCPVEISSTAPTILICPDSSSLLSIGLSVLSWQRCGERWLRSPTAQISCFSRFDPTEVGDVIHRRLQRLYYGGQIYRVSRRRMRPLIAPHSVCPSTTTSFAPATCVANSMLPMMSVGA